MEFISIQKLKTYSTNIAKKIKNGDAIYLYGEIGAGKTTFVRFLINYLQKSFGKFGKIIISKPRKTFGNRKKYLGRPEKNQKSEIWSSTRRMH